MTVVCNLQQHAYVYLCIHEAFVSAPAYGSHVCVFVFKTLISICRNDTLCPCFQGPTVSCIHYTHYTVASPVVANPPHSVASAQGCGRFPSRSQFQSADEYENNVIFDLRTIPQMRRYRLHCSSKIYIPGTL